MDKRIESMATLFQALGDPTRLRIIGLLLGGEVCVCDIHESLRITQPKASRHLAYLRRAGLVATRREGLWVHYRLADTDDAVLDPVRQAVAHALGHLKSIREDGQRLQKDTGCCAPALAGTPVFACCTPKGESAS
jgi:ArsR family transcriptional regulator